MRPARPLQSAHMLGRILPVVLLLACLAAPSAQAADLAWTKAQTVSTGTVNAAGLAVDVDADGGAVMAWDELDTAPNGRERIHAATRTRGGPLGPSQTLSPADRDAGGARVVVARDGTAVCVWEQSSAPGSSVTDIVASVRKPGEAFGPAEILTPTGVYDFAIRDVVMNRDGDTIVLATRDTDAKHEDLVTFDRPARGTFTGSHRLWRGDSGASGTPGRAITFSTNIALDAVDGRALITWADNPTTPNGDIQSSEIRAAVRGVNGVYGAEQLVAARGTDQSLATPQGFLNGNRSVITWTRRLSDNSTLADFAYRTLFDNGSFTIVRDVGGANAQWYTVGSDPTGAGVAGLARTSSGSTSVDEGYFPADKLAFNGTKDLPFGLTDTPTEFDDSGRGAVVDESGDRYLLRQRDPGSEPTYSAAFDLGPTYQFSNFDRLAVGPDGTIAFASLAFDGLNDRATVRFGDIPPVTTPTPPGATPTPVPTPAEPPPPPEPPVPSAISVAGNKIESGRAAVLTVNVTGAATRVEWFPGTAKARVGTVVGGVLQRSLRTRIAGPTTVTVKVSGPGGETTFSRQLSAPKAPTDEKAKFIADVKPPNPGPVTAVGTEAALTGQGSGCGDMTVAVGALTLSGCMRPITGLSDIPAAERGVLDELSRRYGFGVVTNTAPLLNRATELLDGFVVTGPATLNGLWPIDPEGSARVVTFPGAAVLGSSKASLSVAGKPIQGSGAGFNLSLEDDNGSVDLGEVQRPAGLTGLGGFPFTGAFTVRLNKTDATIETNLTLPDYLRRNGVRLEPHLKLSATPYGFRDIDGMALPDLFGVGHGAFDLEAFGLTYDQRADQWNGTTRACIFLGCVDFRPPDGFVRVKGDDFLAQTNVSFGVPGQALAPGVFVERGSFGLGVEPSRMLASARLSLGVALKADGKVVIAGPDRSHPYTLTRAEAGAAFPASFYAARYTAPLIATGADFVLALPVIGEIPFAQAYMLYTSGYLAVGGSTKADLGPFSLEGVLGGEYNLVNLRQNLHGKVSACIDAIGPKVCAIDSVTNVSRGPNLEGGAGACTTFAGVSFGAGVQWAHPEKPFVWPIDGCKWSPFALDVRGRADGPITTVTVKVAGTAKAVRLDGAGDSPRVRVTGPQTLDPGSERIASTPDKQVRIIRADSGDAHFTTVGLLAPGTWRIELLPGSAPITQSAQAMNPQDAKVRGKVARGKGDKRVLRYDVRKRLGQRVTFFDVSSGGARKTIGTTGGGRGTLTFSPAPDTGRHRVVASFTLNDIGAEEKSVTTFRPPSPTLPTPGRVRVRRKGTSVTVTWRGARGASRYELALRAGTQRFAVTAKHRTVFTKVAKTSSGSVTVRAVASQRQSEIARKAFRRTAKAKPNLRGLKRCTVRRKRVKCH